MESWDLLFDLVTYESNGDIVASGVGINNPWQALMKALFKWSPVVACKFSLEDETLSDQVAVEVTLRMEMKTIGSVEWDNGLWLF